MGSPRDHFSAVAACPWCGTAPLEPARAEVRQDLARVVDPGGLSVAVPAPRETLVEYVCPRGCLVEVRSRVAQDDGERLKRGRGFSISADEALLTRRLLAGSGAPSEMPDLPGPAPKPEVVEVDQEQLERARSAVEDLDGE